MRSNEFNIEDLITGAFTRGGHAVQAQTASASVFLKNAKKASELLSAALAALRKK